MVAQREDRLCNSNERQWNRQKTQQPTMGGRGNGGWWLQSCRLTGDNTTTSRGGGEQDGTRCGGGEEGKLADVRKVSNATGICGVVVCCATLVIGIIIFHCATLVIHNNQPKEGCMGKMPATEVKQLSSTSQRNKKTRWWRNTNNNTTTAMLWWWRW